MVISSIRGERPIDEQPAPGALTAPLAADRVSATSGASFSKALRGLGREIDAGEARLAAASQLRHYDTGTLIALQAGIYRYTEVVDLASKIVDRASSAVRTVLQGGAH